MKSTFFKPLTVLLIFILTVSCSVDSEENIEQQVTTNSILSVSKNQTDQHNRVQTNCGDPNLLISDGSYNFYYIFVEYDPSSTKQEKNAIRNPYCNRMVSITQCTTNPNAEIWHVRGACPADMDCKPDIVKPTDPNLRLTTFSNTCISAPI
ncbi:hypothetical protein [uncultured Dokdonia sp.]|uniref:hypothetical protein n=1 Tax=uncultured Dokdonia sp. TaxID=575653 RepID=UPI00262E81A7|nr:hypothetical protein [uncultured Dokdonia sp.]